MVGTSSFHFFPVFLLLLLLLLLSFSHFNNNQFTQVFTSLSPFRLEETNHTTTTPHVSLDGILSTSMYKSTKYKAATIKAFQQQNFTLEKQDTFVPRGSIYRNAYAFYQSHAEMVKRLKVWTYREGDPPLVHNGPLNNIYAIEGHVTGVVHYVYKPITTVRDYSRDRLQRLVTDYINTVAAKYPYWNRSRGADHFMVSCLDWAPEVSHANPQLFKHFIRVLCNANTSEGFRPKIDVSLPEIYLPFGKLGPPDLSRGPNNRPVLAFFAGSPHGYIRKILLEYWKDKDSEVQVHAQLPKDVSKAMASPREVEAIYAGCVPVIILDNYTLPFSDVLNWSQFSVQVPVGKIPEIKTILQGIPDSKYLKMHKRVKRVRRHFELNRPAKPFDVIHMVLHSVWLRRLNFR
ncbi:hypothetical protein ES332_A08G106900v1 [Gossypium tomentosum]|uniref:Exostosin GT47 domain-containing protein n=1 Tax=Gossypium tomentosum TaxID=34277 RepID=A0A5D2PFS3_GOSTO|nr:hypothetical protein ES332_A08G106900v1 [Gossypium tomentosum]